MSDYLEAVGPVRIEPFDYGDAPDWLTLNFDDNIDSDGAAWDYEQFEHSIEQAAAAFTRLAEDLAAVSDLDPLTVIQIIRDVLTSADGDPISLSYPFSDESPDETGGMTIDELVPGIDEQLAEWRKVRDE